MPPEKPASWTGVKNTLAYGPISPQNANGGWPVHEHAYLYQ